MWNKWGCCYVPNINSSTKPKSHLFANNYFTSLPLVSKLKEMQIFFVGKIRKSKLENRLLNEEKELKKKGRG